MKKSELKTMIRTIVREEVAMAIQEVMNELVGGQYGDMMNNNSDVSVDGQTADFLTKDYRSVMKAIDKKKGIK